MCEHFASILHKQAQNIIFGWRERYFFFIQSDQTAGYVHFQIANLKYRFVGICSLSSLHNTHSSQQFACAKWFGQVIIGSGFEPGHLVF